MLEKTEWGNQEWTTIKEGNIGYTWHRTKKDEAKNTTQKTKRIFIFQ